MKVESSFRLYFFLLVESFHLSDAAMEQGQCIVNEKLYNHVFDDEHLNGIQLSTIWLAMVHQQTKVIDIYIFFVNLHALSLTIYSYIYLYASNKIFSKIPFKNVVIHHVFRTFNVNRKRIRSFLGQ